MKKLTFAIITAVLTIGAHAEVSVDAQKNICAKKEWVWVDKSNTCVPVNPCADTSGKFEAYCIRVFKDIQVNELKNNAATRLVDIYAERSLGIKNPSSAMASSPNLLGQDYVLVTAGGNYIMFEFDDISESDPLSGEIEGRCIAYGGTPVLRGWTERGVGSGLYDCTGIGEEECKILGGFMQKDKDAYCARISSDWL